MVTAPFRCVAGAVIFPLAPPALRVPPMQLLVQEHLPVHTRPERDVHHRSVLYQLVERFGLCSIPGCCSGTTAVTVVPLVWILGWAVGWRFSRLSSLFTRRLSCIFKRRSPLIHCYRINIKHICPSH